jgi:hypothetical protein
MPQKDVEAPHSAAPHADTTGGTARRTFGRGMPIAFSYELFNAIAAAGGKPDVEVQTRVFHDGAQVIAHQGALQLGGDVKDMQRLMGAGRLAIGQEMSPGDYVLQIIVTDKLAKSKFGQVTQSVDFRVE